MLSKLMKHEFFSTGRIFLPLYAIVLAVAALTGLLGILLNAMGLLDSTSEPLILLAFIPLVIFGNFLAVGAAFIVPFVVIVVRFYRSFLGPEGHLMFTLPVTRHQLILSKFIPAVSWQAISTLVVLGSVTMAISGWIPMAYWADSLWLFESMYTELLIAQSPHSMLMLFLYFISVPLSVISSILMAYAAMGLGQLSSNNRILLSVVTYFCLWIASMVITTVITLPFTLLELANMSRGSSYLFQDSLLSLSVSTFLSLVLCLVFYFLTEHLLNKRLNLL